MRQKVDECATFREAVSSDQRLESSTRERSGALRIEPAVSTVRAQSPALFKQRLDTNFANAQSFMGRTCHIDF